MTPHTYSASDFFYQFRDPIVENLGSTASSLNPTLSYIEEAAPELGDRYRMTVTASIDYKTPGRDCNVGAMYMKNHVALRLKRAIYMPVLVHLHEIKEAVIMGDKGHAFELADRLINELERI